MSLIDVGLGNILEVERIIFITNFKSSASNRLIQDAKNNDMYVDMSQGRKKRSLIFSEVGNRYILSASYLSPDTIRKRINRVEDFIDKKSEEDKVVH